MELPPEKVCIICSKQSTRVPEATLTLVGGISPAMGTHVRKYERVKAIGGVPGRELPRWYREADVFCLLSIEEGLALVLLQAMAMGLPVIATPNTGAEDLIEDGVHGFIVPARDPKAAAARLQQLADAPELRRQMGAPARARVVERIRLGALRCESASALPADPEPRHVDAPTSPEPGSPVG